MPSYFSGFDLTKINAFGITYKTSAQAIMVFTLNASGQPVRLTDLTPLSSTNVLTSDEFGVVHGGELSQVAPNTKIRFAVSAAAATNNFVERITMSNPAHISVDTDLSLLLDNRYTETPDDIAYIEIYMRANPTADPVRIGTVQPGQTLSIPYNPATDTQIQLFAISWSASGVAHTFDLTAAPTITVVPNRETAIPVISQQGNATNTRIDFRATNFTPLAKFRKIQWASNNTFTSNLVERIDGNAAATTPLSADFFIDRPANASAETVYVRIAHSSGGPLYGGWSEVKTATFANSGGGGGSGGSNPPSNLYGYGYSGDVNLYWTNNGGTSNLSITRSGIEIANGLSSSAASYGDSLYSAGYGYYEYQVSNSDGSTNTWGYLYYNEGGF